MAVPMLEDFENYKYKISILLDVIKRYDTYITSTNAKASLIIAFNSLIIGTVLLKFGDITNLYPTPSIQTVAKIFLVFITVSTLLSLFFVFGVVYPFFGNASEDKLQSSSLIYFGSVSEMSHIEYFESFSSASLEQLLKDLSAQAIILASGLKQKMTKMRSSINAITSTLVLILMMVLFLLLEGSN